MAESNKKLFSECIFIENTPQITTKTISSTDDPHQQQQQQIPSPSTSNTTTISSLNCEEETIILDEESMVTHNKVNQGKSQNLKSSQKFKTFIRKYFLEGQRLNHSYAERIGPICSGLNPLNNAKLIKKWPLEDLHEEEFLTVSKIPKKISNWEKYRKYIGFLIPFAFMHLIWWTLAIRYNIFRLYPTRYQLPLTMILGATVAGMTSEGGGAVAFPVMTLILHINPIVARDFSLMIQSCGMTSAAFTIIWMKIKLEWNSIIFSSLGATIGIVFGLEYVDELIDANQKKMLFVAIWFSFALSLFLLNTQKKRITFEHIQNFNWWKALVLLGCGFVGGICSAFAGSGVDICSFSILTLLFRVSEKVSTPTSVVLMAVNTCVGFFWRQLIICQISELAWDYFSVSVPVVVICAPLGSLLASHFHRLVLATFVYILEILAVIGFLLTGPDPFLVLIGVGIVLASFLFFLGLSRAGKYLHEKVGEKSQNSSRIRQQIQPENPKESLLI